MFLDREYTETTPGIGPPSIIQLTSKASAQAEAQIAEAQIKNQLTLVEIEVAKQAARGQRTEADPAEQEAIHAQYVNIVLQRNSR